MNIENVSVRRANRYMAMMNLFAFYSSTSSLPGYEANSKLQMEIIRRKLARVRRTARIMRDPFFLSAERHASK